MTAPARFDYQGDAALQPVVNAALERVTDPEMALGILDIGLVYRVRVEPGRIEILMTLTSAACPMGDLIVDDIHKELARVLPDREVEVELCWDPAWTPERLSERARRLMGW